MVENQNVVLVVVVVGGGEPFVGNPEVVVGCAIVELVDDSVDGLGEEGGGIFDVCGEEEGI